MNKAKLKSYAPQARKDFIAAVTVRANLLGLSEKAGTLEVAASQPQGDVTVIAGQAWPVKVHSQRDQLVTRIQRDGFDHTMEAVAYTWFNRFAAIRYMELHDYLGHGHRALSSPAGGLPDILTYAAELAQGGNLPGLRAPLVLEMKLAGNRDGELYRLLLVAQCNALSNAMPFLFARIDDDSELLLPDNLLRSDSVIAKLVEANRELVLLYWQIGRDIVERQQAQGWGAKVIDRLAKDLQSAFPDMKGFSRSNLMYMRAFHEAWPDEQFVQQLVGQLPWGQNLLLLTKLKTRDDREWYAAKAIEHGWSRNVMWHHISTQLHLRAGQAVTNFDMRLPVAESELAQQTLKDPYLFDFLGVSDEAHERDIETAMTRHVTKLLMELGEGFAFVGRQVHVEVDGHDFYIDLLFYNYRLHRFLVVELKAGDFKPEHAGQLNFYVTLVDEKIKSEEDKPTLGLLLCKQQHRVVAEYALRGMTQPIGIAEYRLQLPDDFAKYLPSIEQIEAELQGDD